MGTLAIALVALSLIGAGAIIYGAEEEFIPLSLEGRPTQFGTEVNMENYEQDYDNILSEIPKIENIKRSLYVTTEAKIEVINYYKREITEDDYTLLSEYTGEYNVEGVPVMVLAFEKGITAIVIGIMDSKDIEMEKETTVLYTTGAIWDYQEILNWYNEN
jgi:hypothetical protein